MPIKEQTYPIIAVGALLLCVVILFGLDYRRATAIAQSCGSSTSSYRVVGLTFKTQPRGGIRLCWELSPSTGMLRSTASVYAVVFGGSNDIDVWMEEIVGGP